MSFTSFLVTRILQAVGHAVPYSASETWVGLLDSASNEIANVDYARQRIDAPAGTSPKWSAVLVSGGAGRIENDAVVSWATATIDWIEVHGAAVYDAQTGGNQLMKEALPAPKLIFVGETFRIPAQALKIRLT